MVGIRNKLTAKVNSSQSLQIDISLSTTCLHWPSSRQTSNATIYFLGELQFFVDHTHLQRRH